MLQRQTKYMAHSLLARPKTVEESNLLISHIVNQEVIIIFFYHYLPPNRQTECRLWHYRMSSFYKRDTKLGRVLDKTQHSYSRKIIVF